MKPEARYPEFVGVKFPRSLMEKIRRAAVEDDRTVSSYLRRLVASALEQREEERDDVASQ